MTALGLDIATVTGAAFDSDDPRIPRFVTYRAPKPAGDNQDGFEYGRTFSGFHLWLSDLIKLVRPAQIAMEAPLTLIGYGGARVMTSQTTIRILFGLAAIAEMTASEVGIAIYETNVATVKKHFAGSGRADKSAMLARCRQLGWPARNDHEADAAAVWSYIKSLVDPKWAPASTPLFARRA